MIPYTEERENLPLVDSLPWETVITITILYYNVEAMVWLLDGDVDFFDIVSGILKLDTLVPFLFIIRLDYVLQTLVDLIKENGITQKKRREKADDTPQK